jgi:hypothetical protein
MGASSCTGMIVRRDGDARDPDSGDYADGGDPAGDGEAPDRQPNARDGGSRDGASGSGDGGTDPAVDPVDTNPPVGTGGASSKLFNGLRIVQDRYFAHPKGAQAATAATMPAELASNLPSVPDVHVKRIRDSIIVSVANVAGAADYRAYIVDAGVSFAAANGATQPRGATIACAGYRQLTYQSEVVNGTHSRQLMQVIELPGFMKEGDYTVVVEAIASPCPFVGLPSQRDAQITIENDGSTTVYHRADANAYGYTGIPLTQFRSFETVKREYGNVILNGQGASIDFRQRARAPFIGRVVPPNDPQIPADPVVIARSAVRVDMPALTSLPVVDVGPRSLVDDFTREEGAVQSAMKPSPDYGMYNSFTLNPTFQLNTWVFWSRYMQGADRTAGVANNDPWSEQALSAVQAFTKAGRLYTTFGDSAQDVGGSLGFASQVAPVVEVGGEGYVHSVFRVNVEATHRRYWWWVICGGQTSAEVYDSTRKQYNIRPLVFETTFSPGGNNPSVPDGRTLESATVADNAVGVAKECLSITEEARPVDPTRADGGEQSGATLRAQIHPANKTHGIIGLGNNLSDPEPNSVTGLGFRYRIGPKGERQGLSLAPFDQLTPATFDVYVRPDRVVLYVNDRLEFCVDLTPRPLTMRYAMITYGDLLYHSSIEWQEVSDSSAYKNPQMYQMLLNSPVATSRVWDFIGHSDHVGLPADFDPAVCRPPSRTQVLAYR